MVSSVLPSIAAELQRGITTIHELYRPRLDTHDSDCENNRETFPVVRVFLHDRHYHSGVFVLCIIHP